MNVRFGSFYNVHVTRKKLPNDVRTKKGEFYVDLIDTLSVVAKELKKRHRSRSLSLLPKPFYNCISKL